jgi:hypothetical protein
MALLSAVPATVGCKVITGADLFSPAQLRAIGGATNWDSMITALGKAPSSVRRSRSERRLVGDSNHDRMVAAAALEFVAFTSRGVSLVMFILRESTRWSSSKDVFTGVKIGADYLTWVMGMTAMAVMPSSNTPTATRSKIDRGISIVSVLSPMRDTYALYYRRKHGVDSPYAPATRNVEAVGGIAIAILAVVSFGLQLSEPVPSGLDRAVWRTAMVAKLVQNLCSGAYYFLAFTQLPQFKTSAQPGFRVRTLILAVRIVANAVRAIIQLDLRYADYDGPI